MKKTKVPGHTLVEDIEGLGDKASASYQSGPSGPEAVVTSLTVLRGADVVTITYSLNPAATPEGALSNAKQVATETLAKV